MPVVVTYWQLVEDEQEFFEFLAGTGAVVAVPNHWVKSKAELAPRSIAAYFGEVDPPQVCLGLEAHVLQATIEPQKQNGEEFFSFAQMSPCMITYSRGRQCDRKLGQSNVSAYLEYPSTVEQKMVNKVPEFVAWTKKVFTWLRRKTPEQILCNGYPYRATTRAKSAVDRGELIAVLY